MVNEDVFHAYDIRGRSPGELDADFAYRLGQAVVEEMDASNLIVGRDMRATSAELSAALIDGMRSRGADVYDIGLCTTPLFYYAGADVKLPGTGELADAGVMVTASHNPSEYNGFKIIRRGAVPVGLDSGLRAIRERMQSPRLPDEAGGAERELSVLDAYIQKLEQIIPFGNIKPMTIAVDAGNGMAGATLPALFARLPQLNIRPLFFELDGRFPNHEPNPIKRETMDSLCRAVLESKSALGVAFDGDADRIGFVDEQGTYVPVDLVFALIARELLRTSPGGTVLYDVRESRVLAEEVRAAGGRPEMHRVGHVFFKESMRARDALFGAELSGHCYWQSFFNVESTDLALLYVLTILSRDGRPFSEIMAPLRRYHHSGEINFTVADTAGALRALREKHEGRPDARLSELDGIRFDYPDWWFSVRASNTEPLLRLNAEAGTKEKLDEVVGEISEVINQHARRL